MHSFVLIAGSLFGRSSRSKEIKLNGGSTPTVDKKVSWFFPCLLVKKGFRFGVEG
jgi:hypothetical protein